jgi:hypothetical protein
MDSMALIEVEKVVIAILVEKEGMAIVLPCYKQPLQEA